MSGKIISLDGRPSPQTLLAQVSEREGMEAVVMVVRVNGSWSSCWSNGNGCGSLSMAALKLLHDVTNAIHGAERSLWTKDDEPPDAA